MRIGAQPQEMKQIVQINLPIPLGVNIGRQVHPRKLPRQPLLAILGNHRFVIIIGAGAVGFENF